MLRISGGAEVNSQTRVFTVPINAPAHPLTEPRGSATGLPALRLSRHQDKNVGVPDIPASGSSTYTRDTAHMG
jgi:hypothetical protein